VVTVPARGRNRLERLCRYVAHPAVASERLRRLDDGRLIYRLKRRWRDGTAAFGFEPEEFVARLRARRAGAGEGGMLGRRSGRACPIGRRPGGPLGRSPR
jgi:hypothetical protein